MQIIAFFHCLWFTIYKRLFSNAQRFNTLNAELNPICHLLALLGAHPILHVSRIRVKGPSRRKFRNRSTKTQLNVCTIKVNVTASNRNYKFSNKSQSYIEMPFICFENLEHLKLHFFLALRPNAGNVLLIHEVSKSHTTTHNNR
jgi:hypothetical protein